MGTWRFKRSLFWARSFGKNKLNLIGTNAINFSEKEIIFCDLAILKLDDRKFDILVSKCFITPQDRKLSRLKRQTKPKFFHINPFKPPRVQRTQFHLFHQKRN